MMWQTVSQCAFHELDQDCSWQDKIRSAHTFFHYRIRLQSWSMCVTLLQPSCVFATKFCCYGAEDNYLYRSYGSRSMAAIAKKKLALRTPVQVSLQCYSYQCKVHVQAQQQSHTQALSYRLLAEQSACMLL